MIKFINSVSDFIFFNCTHAAAIVQGRMCVHVCEYVCAGVDSLASYEQVLRSLRYMHNNPEGLFERQFRLSCSELNGRYMSNPFQLDVSGAARSSTSTMIPDHALFVCSHVRGLSL